jgi:hypothetical protein
VLFVRGLSAHQTAAGVIPAAGGAGLIPLRAIRMTMLVASLRGAFDFCDAGVYRADGEFGLLFVD